MTGLGEECAELRIGQLEREVERLTRDLAARTAEVAGWARHCTNLESDVERAHELVRSLIAAHDEITVSLAERTRERDDLSILAGSALVRASLPPGESMFAPTHALTEAIERLRGDRDGAWRMCCEVGQSRGDCGTREQIAAGMGRAYLYPETTEEPQP